MNENERPKLNLRKRTSQEDAPGASTDEDVEQLLSRFTEAKATNERPSKSHVAPKRKLKSEFAQSSTVLRDRVKKPTADIGEVWEDLKKRQIPDDESDGMLANREIGEVIDKMGAAIGGASQRFKSAYKSATAVKKPSRKQPRQPMRPRQTQSSRYRSSSRATLSSPKLQASPKHHSAPRKEKTRYRDVIMRRKAVLISAVVVVVGAGVLLNVFDRDDKSTTSATKGVSVSAQPVPRDNNTGASDPEIVAETDFPLLVPVGKTIDELEIARVNPPESDSVYAFIDTLQGVELRISQQQIPESFKGQVASKLEEIAKDFQATDTILIDDNTVYHGFTERFGGVQSLVFIKSEVMVFISSAQKFSDDVWTSYILNLNLD